MNQRTIPLILILTALLTACSARYNRMQHDLHVLSEKNQADTVFTSTAEAQRLVRYFRHHGTPNERMLAHYLLGRAYSDMHDAPMAIECFKDAIEAADTTSEDCDYRQLGIVNIQMANLFYHQNLLSEMILHANAAEHCAMMIKDTLLSLTMAAQKVSAYSRLNMPDSIIAIGQRVSRMYKKLGRSDLSAIALCSSIDPYVERGEYEKAKSYMDIYESESRRFDGKGNIEKGCEIYYYTKGKYYLAIHQYDSAEYWFRKELREGRDFSNQNAASRGLAQLFRECHEPDSAAKYALYSNERNDSMYAQMATRDVKQMQSLYDYSHYAKIAQKKALEAHMQERRLWIACIGIFVVALIAYIIYSLDKKRRERLIKEYEESVKQLGTANYMLVQLRDKEIRSEDVIRRLEAIVSEQKEKISRLPFRQLDSIGSMKEKIMSSSSYRTIATCAQRGKELSDEEKALVREIVISQIPKFYEYISSVEAELSMLEYQVCLLTRLYFKPLEISNMLGISQPYVTKMRNSILQKLFNEGHSVRELDELLQRIC